MTRDELIRELTALSDRAMQSKDTLAAAGVLSSLLGALLAHQEIALLNHCGEFSQDLLRGLSAREN